MNLVVGFYMCNDSEDTLDSRKLANKRGPRGTDWWKYHEGVPPEDDYNDYEWDGTSWVYYDGGYWV